MCSLINKQLLLTAYAYLFIMGQQGGQHGSDALQMETLQEKLKKLDRCSKIFADRKHVENEQKTRDFVQREAQKKMLQEGDNWLVSQYLIRDFKNLKVSHATAFFKHFLITNALGVPEAFLEEVFPNFGGDELKEKLKEFPEAQRVNAQRVEILWAEFSQQLQKIVDSPKYGEHAAAMQAAAKLVTIEPEYVCVTPAMNYPAEQV